MEDPSPARERGGGDHDKPYSGSWPWWGEGPAYKTLLRMRTRARTPETREAIELALEWRPDDDGND